MELLLKEYHANPNNIVGNVNKTALMSWAAIKDRNLSILRLLVEYRFDFANLVNQPNSKGYTVFHALCNHGNTDHNIACLMQLFSICKKIHNCSINILAQDPSGWCGLHYAIYHNNVDMIKYLLENAYFPNNDKLNKDGIAFINMRIQGSMSLTTFFMKAITAQQDCDVKRGVEMFNLFVSYGMKFNSEDEIHFVGAIGFHKEEFVEYILNQNLYHIDTFEKIIVYMYEMNARKYGSINTKILKSFYNYGLEHGLIWYKTHHTEIMIKAARYNLATFKTTMKMILEKHGIKDLTQHKQCDIIDGITLLTIAESTNTNPNVKLFIEALMCDNETQLLKLDDAIDGSNQVVLTCINNHEIKINNENKIVNYKQICSICGDNSDGSQSLCGFKCDECKSFICDDCIIVQTISKKIDDNGNNSGVLHAVVNEIFEYKNNKKLFNKVELMKFSVSFLYLFC